MAKLSKTLKVAFNNATETTATVIETGLDVVNNVVSLVNPVADIIGSSSSLLKSEANILNQMVEVKLSSRLSDKVEAKLRLIMSSLTLSGTLSAIKSLTDADITEVKSKDITLSKKLDMARKVVSSYETAIEAISTDDLETAMSDIAKLEEKLEEQFSTLQLGIKGLIGL